MADSQVILRGMVSKHLKFDSMVTLDRAISVVESLVTKNAAGTLSDSDKVLYDQLKAQGFIGELD